MKMKNNFMLFATYFFVFVTVNIISIEALNCYTCSDKDNSNCLAKPNEVKSEQCKENEIYCMMSIDEGNNLVRKCASKECNTATCKTCSEDNCNKEENFPIATRLKCLSCDGEDCSDTSTMYCPKYKTDECYLYLSEDNKKIIRGCKSQTEICKKDETKCFTCKENNCNTNEKGIQDLKCYECSGTDGKCKRPDPSTGDDCVITAEKKYCDRIITGQPFPKDTCYIKQIGNNVKRGCTITDKPTKDENSILNKVSADGKANGNCIKDLECIKCNSNDNKKCADDNEASLKDLNVKCEKFSTSCYRSNDDNGNTYRDCGGVPATNTQNTSYCYETKCIPLKLKHKCYKCNSNKSGEENCAQLNNKDNIPTEDCDDDCVVLIGDKNSTIRGCKKDVLPDKKCEGDKVCYQCSGRLCNGIIFPLDRRQCFQCQNCNNVKTEKSLPCPIYKSDDKCYMYIKDNQIIRGCLSDTLSSGCEEAKEQCYSCESNNCNNRDRSADSKFQCIKCEKDDDCQWGFNEDQALNCKNGYDFWKTESCYTCNEDGKVSRGCTLDANGPLSDKCHTCGESRCNRKNEIPFTCIRCRSDNPGQESCGKDAANIKPSACKLPVSKADKGCATYHNVQTGVVIRGCLVDFIPRDQERCKDKDYKLCTACFEQDCNKNVISGGSTYGLTTSIIILGLLTSVLTFI